MARDIANLYFIESISLICCFFASSTSFSGDLGISACSPVLIALGFFKTKSAEADFFMSGVLKCFAFSSSSSSSIISSSAFFLYVFDFEGASDVYRSSLILPSKVS